MSELEKMTLVELKTLAKENNIKNISKLKKDELIEILNKVIISSKKEENLENINNSKSKEENVEKHYDSNGEPIVESPDDAIKTFLNTNIDVLVLEHFIVYK